MSANSKIEWTDHTFNPWEGCQKVGPGCDHCYAETRNARFGGGVAINWGPGAPRRRTSEANWREPLKWNRKAEREGRRFRVFCASLADVFDNEVPPDWRADLLHLIVDTPHLDLLLLTKRIGNAHAMLNEAAARNCMPRWGDRMFNNIWIGSTVVNQEEADRDIPKLLRVPARVRFLSIEPMLGQVDLTTIGRYRNGSLNIDALRGIETRGILGMCPSEGSSMVSSSFGNPRIDWVIVGGESGPGARPMHPDWARSLRDQCAAAGVPFLFKQWGEWAPAESVSDDDERTLAERWIRLDGSEPAIGQGVDFFCGDEVLYRIGKKAAGRLLDGVQHDGFPE